MLSITAKYRSTDDDWISGIFLKNLLVNKLIQGHCHCKYVVVTIEMNQKKSSLQYFF